MYAPEQLNGWVQQHECRAIWIDDQAERTLRSSFIRVVNQSITKREIQIEAAMNCLPAMFSNPSLKSEQHVLGGVSAALLPVLCNRDIGFDQNLSRRDDPVVVRREMLFNRNFL